MPNSGITSIRTPVGLPVLTGWALGLACFAYLMMLPPTLGPSDESYMLYGSKRIVQGQALYKDFFDFQTPFSFYLYAIAYSIGGISITSARVTTALLHALCVIGTYFLSLQIASVAEAILAGLLVVVICVPVWNMGSHHWVCTAFSVAAAAVLLAPRWAQSTRARPAAAGALAGLVVSTTTSRALWLLLWLAVELPLVAYVRGGADRWRRCSREVAWGAIGGAAVCLPIFGYAIWQSSLAEMVYSTFTWVTSHYGGYRLPWMGGEQRALMWAVAHATHTWPWLFEAVPALLAVETAMLLGALWRQGLAAQHRRGAVLLLAVTAIAGIFYFPDPVHLAFVLPAVLVVLAGMVYRARTTIARWAPGPMTHFARLAWVLMLAVVLVKGARNAQASWRENPILYETAFGTLAGNASQQDTIRDLRRHLASGGQTPRLLAYPADAWIYLALPADNPTRITLIFAGTNYNAPEQMSETIDRLKNDPRAAVLVNTRFGDPADPFGAFLKQHYRRVVDIGPTALPGKPPYRLYLPGNGDR